MSILVKGVDMPKRCIECPLCQHIQVMNSPLLFYACAKGMRVMYSHETAEGVDEFCKMQKPDWCPLVEVPAPHGRLIDADEQIKLAKKWIPHPDAYIEKRNADIVYYLEQANTVIEAEE